MIEPNHEAAVMRGHIGVYPDVVLVDALARAVDTTREYVDGGLVSPVPVNASSTGSSTPWTGRAQVNPW